MCGLSVCLWMCERVSVSVLEWVVLSNVETPPCGPLPIIFRPWDAPLGTTLKGVARK